MSSKKPSKPDPRDVIEGLRQRLPVSAITRVEPILEEILTLYYPPFRAEDDVELLRLSIVGMRPYVEDLADFTPDVLADGWRSARRSHKTERWPTIQAIRDACIAKQPARPSGGPSGGAAAVGSSQPAPIASAFWDRVRAAKNGYVDRFMLNAVGQQATAEGWAFDLRAYVRGVAEVQAQEVELGRRSEIDVAIPTEEIQAMKDRARTRGESNNAMPLAAHEIMSARDKDSRRRQSIGGDL